MERALPETHEHTGLRPCSGYVEDCQPPGGTDVPVRCVLPHTEGWDTARTQTSPNLKQKTISQPQSVARNQETKADVSRGITGPK